MTTTMPQLPTTDAAKAALAGIVAAGYTPTPGVNAVTDPAAVAFRRAVKRARYVVAATLAPPAAVLYARPTKATVKAYPDYYINGPGYAVASKTMCDHGCHLTDSCPGCDYDDEYGLGVFSGR